MHIDPALLSSLSALLGALIGGAASLLAAIYTQRGHDRIQRVANELTKRETVYADFVMNASKLLLNAYTHDEITRGGDEHRLVGLITRPICLWVGPPGIREGQKQAWCWNAPMS